MKLIFLFLLISFASSVGFAGKSCNVDKDFIRNRPELKTFEEDIFHEISNNIHKKEQGEEAERDLEDLYMSGTLDSGTEQNLSQLSKEGREAAKIEAERGQGNKCSVLSYKMEVIKKVRDMCDLETPEGVCTPWGSGHESTPNDTEYDKITHKDPSKAVGIKESLYKNLEILENRYNNLVGHNQRCDGSIHANLMAETCQGAYGAAFKELPRQEIIENCSLEQVRAIGNAIAGNMLNFAERSCNVVSKHAKNKSAERKVYNSIQKFKRSIACVDHIDPAYCRGKRSGESAARAATRPAARGAAAVSDAFGP